MARKTFQLVLRDARMITPNTREFRFEHAAGDALAFVPGQFIMIHFDFEGESLQRSYSIASIPGSDATMIEIAVSYVEDGRGTRYLWGLQPGDEITASGPYGRFILRKEEVRRYVLVATGTGVAPYRTMLPEIAERIRDAGLQVDLLLGVREPSELLYGDDFEAFGTAHPEFRFWSCYSRTAPEPLGPRVRQCYVQQSFDVLDLDPDHDIVYLCGNPNMVDEAMEQLKSLGFSPYKVRREKYIS